MEIINRKEILKLSTFHDATCISIFVPTQRSGNHDIMQEASLKLKNQLNKVSEKLEKQGLTLNQIKDMLAPVKELVQDSVFWKNQSDGLAIFLADNFFKTYSLPLRFESYNYVTNSFYLKPLMPMFVGDGRFFILTVEMEHVQLYEATRHSIADIYIKDLTPLRLEERVGYDYKEKHLQFRSQQSAQGGATFHGHGGGKENEDNETLRFFRAIDQGLMNILNEEKAPMVLACLSHYFTAYKKVNNYNNLIDDYISGNPADIDKLLLHEKAWEIVQPYFTKEQNKKIDLFKQHQGTDRASTAIEDIVPAAIGGKIDTLFLQKSSDIWGLYHPSEGKTEIHNKQEAPNVPLLNLAAINVFLQGGTVYLMEKNDMPNSLSKVNAVYRYG